MFSHTHVLYIDAIHVYYVEVIVGVSSDFARWPTYAHTLTQAGKVYAVLGEKLN